MAKYTIELEDNYIPILKEWASISRTLNEAKRLIGDVVESLDKEEHDYRIELVSCWDELKDIEPALNALHKALQDALRKGN